MVEVPRNGKAKNLVITLKKPLSWVIRTVISGCNTPARFSSRYEDKQEACRNAAFMRDSWASHGVAIKAEVLPSIKAPDILKLNPHL